MAQTLPRRASPGAARTETTQVAFALWLGLSALVAVFLPGMGVVLARGWPVAYPIRDAGAVAEIPAAAPISLAAVAPATTANVPAHGVPPPVTVAAETLPPTEAEAALDADQASASPVAAAQGLEPPQTPEALPGPSPVVVPVRQASPLRQGIVSPPVAPAAPTAAPAPPQSTAAKAEFTPPTPRPSQPPKPAFSPPH